MTDLDLRAEVRLGPANAAALGVDTDTLILDLAEVEIGESVEIQRRLGLTPRGLAVGVAAGEVVGWDAVVMLAAVWLALRQAGRPRRWDEIKIKTYLPVADAEGKDSTSTEPSES